MNDPLRIPSPDAPRLAALCHKLADRADATDASQAWPSEQLALCGEYGVYEWFLPRIWHGQEWSDADLVRGYVALGQACLTTAFILTQRSGACQRIAASENEPLKSRLLPDLASGKTFTTVAISHLTTSRRYLATPVLTARPFDAGYVLDGYSAWVTGAVHAQHIVTAATLADGRQLLISLPTDLPGVEAEPFTPLVGLGASHTGKLTCRKVQVPHDCVLDGPDDNVMSRGSGGATGGLPTSALALGLAGAAIAYLQEQAERRSDLADVAARLNAERDQLLAQLLALASPQPQWPAERVRARCNSLVLRATQAALTAAKGTGYAAHHRVGRWCREALFFLVWSCPQAVAQANLCELAGVSADHPSVSDG